MLSQPGQSFGPADWQKDATPKYLSERWDRALKVLQMAKENPKASELYTQLSSHLDRCVNVALSNLETLNYWPGEQKTEMRNVLQKVSQSFEQAT